MRRRRTSESVARPTAAPSPSTRRPTSCRLPSRLICACTATQSSRQEQGISAPDGVLTSSDNECQQQGKHDKLHDLFLYVCPSQRRSLLFGSKVMFGSQEVCLLYRVSADDELLNKFAAVTDIQITASTLLTSAYMLPEPRSHVSRCVPLRMKLVSGTRFPSH